MQQTGRKLAPEAERDFSETRQLWGTKTESRGRQRFERASFHKESVGEYAVPAWDRLAADWKKKTGGALWATAGLQGRFPVLAQGLQYWNQSRFSKLSKLPRMSISGACLLARLTSVSPVNC